MIEAEFSALPESWQLRRVKNLLATPVTDGPHETPEFLPAGVPFLSVDGIQDGELVFEGCRFVSQGDGRQFRTKCAPRRDDILLGKAASTGKIARVKVDFEFTVWSPLALLRPALEHIDPGYLEFALKSPATQAQIDMLCTSNTQKNISMRDIPRLVIAVPPLDAQRSIARFLDRETAKIDALVAKKERLIELLQEKRTALITHAVTKGLDPTGPTKLSGIDWVGDIPPHWEVSKPKFVTTRIVDGVHHTPEYVDEGVPFVTVKNLTALPNSISFESINYVSRETHEELIKRAKPECGDLLITKDGTLGVPRVVDTDREFSIFVSVALLKLVRTVVDPEFMRLVFESQTTKAQTQSRKLGSALTHLHLGELANLYFALPALEEQRLVVKALVPKLDALSSLGSRVRTGIDRLGEYRTALISAAVTGKIDVRQEVA